MDLGLKVSKTLFAPRIGASYRIDDKTVLRGGYGKTFDPFPWSRPMRGRFPLTIAHSDAGLNTFTPYGNLSKGIPLAPNPDVSSGTVPLPRGVDMAKEFYDIGYRGWYVLETGSPTKDLVADTRANIAYVKKTFKMPPATS